MATVSFPSLSREETSILATLRQASGLSRAELARRTGFGRTLLEARLDALRQLDLVSQAGMGESSGGKKPELVSFRKEAGYLASVDLGQQTLAVGITNLNAEIVVQITAPTELRKGPDAVLSEVVGLIEEAIVQSGVGREQIWGIGMGLPGPVDPQSGRPISPPVMPGWHAFPVRDYLERELRWPATIDNDVNVMAVGEQWAGLGRSVEIFLYVKTGPGIGCGVVCRGRIYRGANGCAGEIGHSALPSNDGVCQCGKIGCLEAFAGAKALARAAEEMARAGQSRYLASIFRRQGRLTAEDLATAVGHGDSAALELVGRAGTVIGEQLSYLVNFFNPSLIVLGGGVADLGDLLLASVRETIYRCSLPSATKEIMVQRSVLDDEAGLIGAAAVQIVDRYRLVNFT
ncbi:MAG: sugar kinase [Chloroflexi bacterium]|nr:MAG: sugar kinase [Chloroflexota bacterium]